MSSFQSRSGSTRDDWQTPMGIIEALGPFDLDVAANCEVPNRCARRGLTLEDDGLTASWGCAFVWCNPPYGGAAKLWLARMADHGNGIALVPPRMGAKWFQDIVLDTADTLLFMRGRVSFINAATGLPAGGNNADSVLIGWGETASVRLTSCAIKGKIWRARGQ